MDDLADGANSPGIYKVDGKAYEIRRLTLREIGTLNRHLEKVARPEIELLREQLGVQSIDEIDDDERQAWALLGITTGTWKMAERQAKRFRPPTAWSDQGATILTSTEEGRSEFCRVLFSTVERVSLEEAEAIADALNPLELGELYAFAMGTEPQEGGKPNDPKARRRVDL